MDPLDHVPVGCCTIGEDGVILRANRAATNLLEDATETLTTRPFAHFIYADDQGIFTELLTGAPNWGEGRGCELRIRGSGGTVRFVRLEATGSVDDSGARVLTVALIDIDEAKRAEDARARAVGRMEKMQEALTTASLSDAFIAGDIESLAREVTELAAKTLGVERANIWIFNEDETALHCMDLFESSKARHSSEGVLLESQYRNEFEALKSRRFVAASEPLTDPRTRGYADTYLIPLGITSMLDALVEVSGRRLGLLCVEHVAKAHQWEHDEVAFVRQLADKLALTMVNRARRDAQSTLRASEVRYRRLFESAKDGIVIVDAKSGLILDVNPSVGELIGCAREDLLGKKIWDVGALKQVVSSEANLDELLKKEYTRYDQIALEANDGRRIDVEFVSSVYLVERLKVVQCNLRDITERRRAEESLRKLSRIVEQAPIAIAITDLTGAMEYVNPAFCEATGYAKEEILGQNPRILQSGNTAQKVYAEMWAALLEGHVWRGEFVNRRKNGETFVELAVIAPVVNSEDRVTHYVALKEDITPRKEAERALETSLAEKEALLKEVHHRVKNNLQVISSLLRLEAGRREDGATRVVLKEMQNRVLSMALLHEALYRSGDFRSVNLAAYLKQLAEQFFQAQNLAPGMVRLQTEMSRVDVAIDQAIPCGLIVNELMTNSLKHGFAEGKRGEVRVVVRPEGAEQVFIEVSNDGAELPADFETRRTRSLGMQLVSDLARQVGGRLEIGPGTSARFTILFTRATAEHTGPTVRPRQTPS